VLVKTPLTQVCVNFAVMVDNDDDDDDDDDDDAAVVCASAGSCARLFGLCVPL